MVCVANPTHRYNPTGCWTHPSLSTAWPWSVCWPTQWQWYHGHHGTRCLCRWWGSRFGASGLCSTIGSTPVFPDHVCKYYRNKWLSSSMTARMVWCTTWMSNWVLPSNQHFGAIQDPVPFTLSVGTTDRLRPCLYRFSRIRSAIWPPSGSAAIELRMPVWPSRMRPVAWYSNKKVLTASGVNTMTWHAGSVQPGIYFMRMETSDGVLVRKVPLNDLELLRFHWGVTPSHPKKKPANNNGYKKWAIIFHPYCRLFQAPIWTRHLLHTKSTNSRIEIQRRVSIY